MDTSDVEGPHPSTPVTRRRGRFLPLSGAGCLSPFSRHSWPGLSFFDLLPPSPLWVVEALAGQVRGGARPLLQRGALRPILVLWLKMLCWVLTGSGLQPAPPLCPLAILNQGRPVLFWKLLWPLWVQLRGIKEGAGLPVGRSRGGKGSPAPNGRSASSSPFPPLPLPCYPAQEGVWPQPCPETHPLGP